MEKVEKEKPGSEESSPSEKLKQQQQQQQKKISSQKVKYAIDNLDEWESFAGGPSGNPRLYK